jgi:transcriptional regulator GlxA family with amidase domain
MDGIDLALVMPGGDLVARSLHRLLVSPVRNLDAVRIQVHEDWPAPPTELGSPDVVMIDLKEATDRWGERIAARWVDAVARSGAEVIGLVRGPVAWDVDEVLDEHGIDRVEVSGDARAVREAFTQKVLAPRGLVLLSRFAPAEA